MIILTLACQSHTAQNAATPYPADGYLGMTSVNPNMPGNSSYHDYQTDFKFMHEVISQFQEVKHARIQLQGKYADVQIEVNPSFTGDHVLRIRSDVQAALSSNMPRYIIKVTLSKGLM